MIIVRLAGGLGNQMFQYAAGKTLAHQFHTGLKLDSSSYKLDGQRYFALNGLSISGEIATHEEVFQMKYEGEVWWRRFLRKLCKQQLVLSDKVYKEPCFHYDSSFINHCSPTYIDGYWQSEKYFASIAGLIRTEFQPKNPLQDEKKAISERILSCNAVSIHIRRGDYISDLHIREVHGSLSLEYYQKAVSEMARRVGNPVFVVFSDDIAWVHRHFNLEYPTIVVDHNNLDSAHVDLHLMSLCKCNILANSTFSWWGAWLNSNLDKIVIAPKKWFKNSNNNTKDLIPGSWISL